MGIFSKLATAALLTAAAVAAPVNNGTLTISGISAGAAMAIQYQIAFSSQVRAAGIIAGLPYYCAQNLIGNAFECMDSPELIDNSLLIADAQYGAEHGLIDSLANVKKQAVMLFSGLFDTVVNHGSMQKVAAQMETLQVQQLVKYFNYTAEHAWITDSFGNGCSHLGAPYINNCHLDFAGEFLKMAWRHMGLGFNNTRAPMVTGNLRTVSQATYGANGFTNSMAELAYMYVPKACANGGPKCHVHVNFHGCSQNYGSIGTEYVAHTGLNEWAEANDIIVLYPQATGNMLESNPKACFDWWGYAGRNYANKQGAQMAIINKMVHTIMAGGPSALQ